MKTKLVIPKLDYSLLCTIDGGDGIKMAARQSTMPQLPESIQKFVAEIEEARKLKALFVGVNVVPPGSESGKHTDTLTVGYKLELWHLPLVTNKDAWILVYGKEIHMPEGIWCGPFPYWEEHAVGNRGKTDRVHLVVDLDTEGKDVLPEKFEPRPAASSDLKPTGTAVVSKS